MNVELERAITTFLERATSKGVVADADDVRALDKELGGIVPSWYASLVTTYPLCGLELGRKSSEASLGNDDIVYLEWLGPDGVRLEMLDCYPGIALLSKRYLCIAGCCHGSGDQYFIRTDDGDDPPVYQIAHDVSEDPDVIISKGRFMVALRLSHLFQTGVS